MKFLNEFKKSIAKIEGLSHSSQPPSFWFGSGNYVLNFIMTGSFRNKAYAQGRVTGLAGVSGSGKSFLLCNALRQAQQELNAFVYVIDSENALDNDFTTKIGVDVSPENYLYTGVITIGHVKKVVSDFIQRYKDSGETRPVVIAIDSLGMLLTDSEFKQLEDGEAKGDQGQRAKQTKALLTGFVQSIKEIPIAIVVTGQVYQATQDDIYAGKNDGLFVVNAAMKYSLSNLLLLVKSRLKDTADKSNVLGVTIRAEAIKTRFTKPFQKVELVVPYETGMDPYSGLKEVAVDASVIEKAGSRYRIAGTTDTFYWKDLDKKTVEKLIDKLEEKKDIFLGANLSDEDLIVEGDEKSINRQRLENYVKFMEKNPNYTPDSDGDLSE